MKEALHRVPVTASPLPGKTLYVYLAAFDEAISSVLTVERNKKQFPIHFVSRALQSPEVNYPVLEKLVLALFYAAIYLMCYFQSHKIEVLTSFPVKQILLKPEKSGRVAKWAIELGKHDIEYQPQISIKAQTMADFLVEILTCLEA